MLEKLKEEMSCDATQVIINVTESLIKEQCNKLDRFWFQWDKLINYLCNQNNNYKLLVEEYLSQ
mgnify:CR=1 FL=1